MDIEQSKWNEATLYLDELGHTVVKLLHVFLDNANVRVHSMESRTKEKPSAEGKIRRKRDGYGLKDMTDLLGIRIITYLSEDVDRVAAIIGREFAIDWANSIDKRLVSDPARFGYQSLHFVATLPDVRVQLQEYAKYCDRRFEIQIRSILQHAWAEVEHDLGYKNADAVPVILRRRLFRLAGLLELADSEFSAIRQDAEVHMQDVERSLSNNILGISIDRDSVNAYIVESSLVAALAHQMSKAIDIPIDMQPTPESGSWRASELALLGLETIQELDETLKAHGDVVWRFGRNWFKYGKLRAESVYLSEPVITHISLSVPIFYLTLLLALESKDQEVLGTLKLDHWNVNELRRALSDAKKEAATQKLE